MIAGAPMAGLSNEVVARFRAVAMERTERIEEAWLSLTQEPADRELAARLRRELSTLKGDSQVVGFFDVNLLTHKLEDLVLAAEKRRFAVADDFDLVVTMAIRFINVLLRKVAGRSFSGIDLAGFVRQVDDVLREAAAAPLAAGRADALAPPADRLSQETEAQLAASATRVFLEQLSLEGEGRARLHEVWRELAGIATGVGSEPLKARLLRHVHAAKQLGHELGKPVQVAFRADNRLVRSELADALDTGVLHLLRNAIDHGIEDPATRLAAGKPPVATLRIVAQSTAQSVTVQIQDDGQGVDREAVRLRAVERGLLAEDAEAGDDELLELLFRTGFSTRRDVGPLSGRGVGLDAARAALAPLRGTVRLYSRPGEGTRAVLRAPDASRHLEVVCFSSTRPGLLLAVQRSCRVTPAPAAAASGEDPLETLDVGAGDAPRVLLDVTRGCDVTRLVTGGRPRTAVALRVCVTAPEFPVEVVLIDGKEALLLHRGGGG